MIRKIIEKFQLVYPVIRYRCSKYDAFKFFEVMVYSAAIVGFLSAMEYFSKNPSVLISCEVFEYGRSREGIANFYRDFGFNIPKFIGMELGVENDGSFPSRVYNLQIINEMDDISILGCIKNRNCSTNELHEKILELSEAQKNVEYQIKGDPIISTTFMNLDVFLSEIKQKKDEKINDYDYILLLYAYIYAREVDNELRIVNDGNVDLKNVKITIPYPYSRFSKRRDNNLINVRYGSPALFDIDKLNDRLVLNIPKILKGQKLLYGIRTKENRINSAELIYSFDSKSNIDKKWALAGWIIIMGIMLLLAKIFNGRGKSEGGNIR
jgi:hypothetical protein